MSVPGFQLRTHLSRKSLGILFALLCPLFLWPAAEEYYGIRRAA